MIARRTIYTTLVGLVVLCAVLVDGVAAESDSTIVAGGGNTAAQKAEDAGGPTYLVPSLENAGYRISPGKHKFKNRISFSPAIGKLGDENLFSLRLGFGPNTWLGYEIDLGHNPASSLHALLHTFNVVLRYPVPWRAQPFVTLGYGMMTVYPGRAINADPVTKNTITVGGGLEFYIRDDVALRGDVRSANVLGQELGSEGTVTYAYLQYTIGFSFYRNLGR